MWQSSLSGSRDKATSVGKCGKAALVDPGAKPPQWGLGRNPIKDLVNKEHVKCTLHFNALLKACSYFSLAFGYMLIYGSQHHYKNLLQIFSTAITNVGL